MSTPKPVVITDDKELAYAQLAEMSEDQLPADYEVLDREEALLRLLEAVEYNTDLMAELREHPDPRLAITINPADIAMAYVTALVDFLIPDGTIERLAFDLQLQEGKLRDLIEGGRDFQQKLALNVVEKKLIVPK